MKDNDNPIVFTPENEPYLGRESVYHFDQVIISCLELNQEIAIYHRFRTLRDMFHHTPSITRPFAELDVNFTQ